MSQEAIIKLVTRWAKNYEETGNRPPVEDMEELVRLVDEATDTPPPNLSMMLQAPIRKAMREGENWIEVKGLMLSKVDIERVKAYVARIVGCTPKDVYVGGSKGTGLPKDRWRIITWE